LLQKRNSKCYFSVTSREDVCSKALLALNAVTFGCKMGRWDEMRKVSLAAVFGVLLVLLQSVFAGPAHETGRSDQRCIAAAVDHDAVGPTPLDPRTSHAGHCSICVVAFVAFACVFLAIIAVLNPSFSPVSRLRTEAPPRAFTDPNAPPRAGPAAA